MSKLDKETFKLVLVQLNQKYPEIEDKKKLIEDSFYWERVRLSKRRRGKAAEKKFYSKLRKSYLKDETKINSTFRAIIKNHLKEIQGNFSFRVFQFVRRILSQGLRFFINNFLIRDIFSKKRQLTSPNKKIHVTGSIDKVIKLSEDHTLIVVPNHVSNFDSVVIGYGLQKVGIPPFFYGAGLNLFTNPLISFFMRNLGAYKVDREKQHLLYKEILKAYSVAMLQTGKHSLFFPGGTRLRSGGVETSLKRGLLGTTISAQVQSLVADRVNDKKAILVPVMINYQIVMDGHSLVKEYLKEEGRQSYMGDPPDVKKAKSVFRRMGALKRLDTDIYLHVSDPIDVLGNTLDEIGNSISDSGEIIHMDKYFIHNGKPALDENRDRVFTRFTAEKIVNSYMNSNILTYGNLICYALYRLMGKLNHTDELFEIIYLAPEDRILLKADLISYLLDLQRYFMGFSESGLLNTEGGLLDDDPEKMLAEVEARYNHYHSPGPFKTDAFQIKVTNPTLLIYYANRIRLVDMYGPPAPTISQPRQEEES